MATLGHLAVVLAVTSAAWSALPEEPCYGESCTNFTIFLGPKFGAKTIRLPVQNHTELKRVNVVEMNEVNNGTKYQTGVEPITKTISLPMQNYTELKGVNVLEEMNEVDNRTEYQTEIDPIKPISNLRPLFPRHRPVPGDGNLAVEYLDVDRARFTFGTDESDGTTTLHNKSAIDNVNQLFDSGFLNLGGFGLTGMQAKQILYNLSNSSKSQLTHLTLSRNQLKSLPKLFFPVELEYGLQELCLDDNPLGRIDSYTSFELSRLASLRKLSLARTGLGLAYLLAPNIPSLEVLDLSGNELTYFPFLPKNLLSLRELNLSSNKITFVNYLYDSPLVSLQILNLANNALQNIIMTTVAKNMPNLQTLYLNNNSLKYGYQIEDFSLRTTLYLAGNPWECSCPLVRVVHRKYWPEIKDKELMRCTDDNINVPWPVMSLREVDVTVACPSREASKGWLRTVASKLGDVWMWFRYRVRYYFTFSTFFNLLWWVLLIVTLVAVVRTLRHHKREASPATIPYTILDDKNVI